MLDQDTLHGSVWRFAERLVNQVPEGLFAPAGAARSTRVLVYNHTPWALHRLTTHCETGRFAHGEAAPAVIAPKSVGGYRVVGDGPTHGVTGAVVEYGFRPTDQYPCVWLVTSNPFGGANSWNGQGYGGLTVRFAGSTGPANQVDYDVWETPAS